MILCTCGAPTERGDGMCGNCGYKLTDEARLNVSDLSDNLYQLILQEFKIQHGRRFNYTNWELKATMGAGDTNA